jgi:nucleotide-binding universal stress UspA family protein
LRGSARVETLVGQGAPAAEILRIAAEQQASLIVIATHGRTGLKRLALGSVAEQVIREAPCPVLVVR